jgi:hypothetical protein
MLVLFLPRVLLLQSYQPETDAICERYYFVSRCSVATTLTQYNADLHTRVRADFERTQTT